MEWPSKCEVVKKWRAETITSKITHYGGFLDRLDLVCRVKGHKWQSFSKYITEPEGRVVYYCRRCASQQELSWDYDWRW